MIKILIVDDSETAAALLANIIGSESDMCIIGVAKNGLEALTLTLKLKPDLITMDIQMPIMDGLEATRRIVSECPTPIIVISSTLNTESMEPVFHILDTGALSALPKPVNIFEEGFESLRKNIINTIRAMTEIKVAKRKIKNSIAPFETTGFHSQKPIEKKELAYEVLALGVSVGGPQALKTIFSQLPSSFPLPIIIVQHMSQGFIEGYAKWLTNNTQFMTKIAENLEKLQKGVIYIAPDDYHMLIERINNELHIKLLTGIPVDGFYPSISVLLDSVAKVCGASAIGGLLTGMGSDGAQGLLAMKRNNSFTFIQDKESAIVFGMAGVAESLGAVDVVLNLNDIANFLQKMVE